MNSDERKRVIKNKKCISIIYKPIEQITEEERQLLKENYSGYGSVLGVDGLAQFFTPDCVSKFIADYINPKLPPNAKILEPSAGAGSLLKYIKEDTNITCVKIDEISSKILKICTEHEVINDSAMNHCRENYYDAIISNPPFNITIEGDIQWDCTKLDKKLNKYKANSDNFFLEMAVKSLKVGGYGIFILPSSIGFKSALKKTREFILDNCWFIANIELPPETFSASGTTIKTHILIFRKAPKLPKYECTSYDKIEGNQFLLGQPPICCIQINDIGYDSKGNLTHRYDDDYEYNSQLDEALDMLEDTLYLHNTCPENPCKENNDEYLYWKEADLGYETNRNRQDKKALVFFETQTLGRGKEIEFEGEEYSTLDWDVMDRLIEKYKNVNKI